MIFDNEEQRQIVLELLAACTIPGAAIDKIFKFKQEVIRAKVSNAEGKKNEPT